MPRWDNMARDDVVAWSHDAHGSIMGRAHTNPILDTRMHQVKFAGSQVKELALNITAESKYAQCDVGQNEYLLLEVLVDY